jgi:hypothetical protein
VMIDRAHAELGFEIPKNVIKIGQLSVGALKGFVAPFREGGPEFANSGVGVLAGGLGLVDSC